MDTLNNTDGNGTEMDLRSFDHVLVNTSAGKDSQAMLDLVVELATVQGVLDRVTVVHADLGRAEWKGTRELAIRQAAHYGLTVTVVTRPQGDLLDHIEARGMWPSNTARFCTSDHKRDQVAKVMTKMTGRILNCMGLRKDESPKRAKMTAFEVNPRATNTKRQVWNWLPIHTWTTADVWTRIKQSGVEHHPAYDLGMPRLSCVFCVFSPLNGLLLAGKHNPELLAEYVRVEKKINHTFTKDLSITKVSELLAAGVEPTRVQNWTM